MHELQLVGFLLDISPAVGVLSFTSYLFVLMATVGDQELVTGQNKPPIIDERRARELASQQTIAGPQNESRRRFLRLLGLGSAGAAVVTAIGGGAAAVLTGSSGNSSSNDESNAPAAPAKNDRGNDAPEKNFKEAPHDLGYFAENWRDAGPRGIPTSYEGTNWVNNARRWRSTVFPGTKAAEKAWRDSVVKGNPKHGLELRDRNTENILFGTNYEVAAIEGFEQGVVSSDGKGVYFGFTITGMKDGSPLPENLKNRYFLIERAKSGIAVSFDPYMILQSEYYGRSDAVLKEVLQERLDAAIANGFAHKDN